MREPFSFNSFYLLVLRKIMNSLTKMTNFPHGRKPEIFFLQYVLDLIDLSEQTFCPDSKLRVKLMYGPSKILLKSNILCSKILGIVKFFLKSKNFLKSNMLKSKIYCIYKRNSRLTITPFF